MPLANSRKAMYSSMCADFLNYLRAEMIWLSSSRFFGQPRTSFSCYCRGVLLCVFIVMIAQVHCDDHHIGVDGNLISYEANIKYSYSDSNKRPVTKHILGKFGAGTQPKSASFSGKIVHVTSLAKRGKTKTNHFGCEKYTNDLPSVAWIALVERGECEFTRKIRIATVEYNASAAVIYDNETTEQTLKRHKDTGNNVAVFISRENGRDLVRLLDKGVQIEMDIHRGQRVIDSEEGNINNSSVLFVSISFIIIVIISVTWLMFYYIRKFRYSHTKERLAKRLARAAKKAIAKIPQRTVNAGDKELEGDFDQCAVCIEPYKDGDIIRLMPCRHIFHKSCVDPWLLDHRTCPMCKLDILQAFGMSMGKLDMLAYGMQGSQESVHRDPEEAAIMLEAVDGAGRSQATALILDDHEASSSLEDEAQANSEVKVVLVPHSCLHYHHHRDGSRPSGAAVVEDEEEEDVELEPSTGLLTGSDADAGASHWDDIGPVRGSTASINSSGSGRNNTTWATNKGGAVSCKSHTKDSVEMEALIHPFSEDREELDGSLEIAARKDSLQYVASQTEGVDMKSHLNSKKASRDSDGLHSSGTAERKSSDPVVPLVTEGSDDIHLQLETDDSQELNKKARQSDV